MIDLSSVIPFIVLILFAIVIVKVVRTFLGQSRRVAEAEQSLAGAPTTGGVVVDTYKKRRGGMNAENLREHDWVTHFMVVRFTTADGRTVEFRAMAVARVGQKVEVRYDPANPESTYVWKLNKEPALQALHKKSGFYTRGGSSTLNKLPLLVVACNLCARPRNP